MKDKGFKIIFGISILLLILDFITTILNWELVKHLESNPLFRYGGLPLIILTNIGFFTLYWFWYKHSKHPTHRFYIIFCLVAMSITRPLVIYNNYQVYLHPPTLEQAIAVTTAIKMQNIKKILILNILPIFNGLIAFTFFDMDHKINKKEERKDE